MKEEREMFQELQSLGMGTNMEALCDLSLNQTSLFVMSQDPVANVAMNIPVALQFDDQLDVVQLKQSLQKLLEYHASLRCVCL